MSSSVPIPSRSNIPGRQATMGVKDLRPSERVAVILSLLEPHQAKAIADQLDEGAIDRVISAYEDMRTVPKPVLLQIIAG
ncbi:MAG: hypothetical protein AAF603_11390, partial [Pseudomonadota bacterium]